MSLAQGSLVDALVDALVARGGRTGSPVVVGHPEDPVVSGVQAATGRVVVAPGAGARLLVACGVADAGACAIVLAEEGAVAPRRPVGQVVPVARDPEVAEGLRRAGWALAQPVWGVDVEALLDAVLATDEPVALRLHGRSVAVPAAAPPPPALGRPRVLADGRTGVVVAAGALVADVLAARGTLNRQGLDVAIVDAHTRGPHAARGPLADADDRVLVGGPRAAQALAAGRLRLGTLQVVEVPAGADTARLLGERIPLRG